MNQPETSATGQLYTRDDLARELDVDVYRIRNLLRSGDLIEIVTGEGKRIPQYALIADDGRLAINPALRGTLMTLQDHGLSAAEASMWLITINEELGTSPLAALAQGHIHSVRRAIVSTAIE